MKSLRSIGLPVALLSLTANVATPHFSCLLAQAPLTASIQEEPSAIDSGLLAGGPQKSSAPASPQTLKL